LAKHKDAIPTHVSDLTVRVALELLDTRTDLERALAFEAEAEALAKELGLLGDALDTADVTEVVCIHDRAEEIARRAAEIRLRALSELGRLIKLLESPPDTARSPMADLEVAP